MQTFSLSQMDTPKHGGLFLDDWSTRIKRWRRTWRRRGGCWIGTGEVIGTPAEKQELFLTGLLTGVHESDAGEPTWLGMITEMALTIAGITFKRSVFQIANWVKMLYTSVGDNLLTNGGGESSAWVATNTPITLEQSATWRTEGSYSIHIVAGAAEQGAKIQGAVAVVAATPYDAFLSVKVVSGKFKLSIIKTGGDETLAENDTSGLGEMKLQCSILDSSDYAGNVDLIIEAADGAGEIFCDGGIFQRGPLEAESSIVEDAVSQREYGRIEAILLRASMHTDSANNEVLKELRARAWPGIIPPGNTQARYLAELMGYRSAESVLHITASGRFAALNFRHSSITGTDLIHNHVRALLAASDSTYVGEGVIDSNNLFYQIEPRAPVLIGDTLLLMAEAGEVGTGLRYEMGVDAYGRLHYRKVPSQLSYHVRGGILYDITDQSVPGWRVRPGWIYLDDAPVSPQFASINPEDDPHWMYADEVEYLADEQQVLFNSDSAVM